MIGTHCEIFMEIGQGVWAVFCQRVSEDFALYTHPEEDRTFFWNILFIGYTVIYNQINVNEY